jgi:DNA invertase Pin-like site-specific DNA recombinase
MPRKTSVAATDDASGAVALIGYYRVSTERQGVSGLGIEAQKAAVAEYVARSGGLLIHEFEETESGKKSSRPQLAAALAACRQHKARLVVAKLDRLARNTAFLLSIADGVGEAGVVFCDLPQLPPGPMGKFFLTLMAAVAELEAGLISQRTKAALAARKARGGKLGNPHLLTKGAGPARKRQARAKAREILPFIRAAEKAGCKTLQEKADALTARGIRTPSGGTTWAPEQIRRALKQAQVL